MKFILLSVVLLLAAGQSIFAAGIESGEAAYERCALCHGLYGNTSRSKFPRLAGQNPRYLEQQIRHFLSGYRSNDGGQMSGVVTEITEDDIEVVVEWFSTQEDPQPAGSGSDVGANLYVEAGCTSCHSGNSSDTEIIPLLSSQHQAYLVKQMQELRDGGRQGGEDGLMLQQLMTLTDADTLLIAEHLAAQERAQ